MNLNIYYKKIFVLTILSIVFVFIANDLSFAGKSYTLNLQDMDVSSYKKDQSIKLLVSVTDENGYSPLGLEKENFVVIDDGKKVSNYTLDTVSLEKDPVAVVLVFDVSGSMIGEPISQARKSALTFIRGLEKNDRAAIHTFDTEYKPVHNLTRNKEELSNSIKSISPARKNTALNDAIYESLTSLKGKPEKRKVVVILTDGRENASRKFGNAHKLLNYIEDNWGPGKENIPIFTVGLGHDISQEFLKKVANISGGKFYYAPKPQDLEDIYEKISREIKNQYIIRYKPGRQPDTYQHHLDLQAIFQGKKAGRQELNKKLYYLISLPLPEESELQEDSFSYSLIGGGIGFAIGLLPFLVLGVGRTSRRKRRALISFIILINLTLMGFLIGHFLTDIR